MQSMLTARPLMARPPAAVAARLPSLRPTVATPLRAVAAAATGDQAVAKTKYTRGSAHKVGGVGCAGAMRGREREGRGREPGAGRDVESTSVRRVPPPAVAWLGRHTPHCHPDVTAGVCPVAVAGGRQENARWEGRAWLESRRGPAAARRPSLDPRTLAAHKKHAPARPCPHPTHSIETTSTPSQQLRRVLDSIRGRSYEEALMILEFLPYRAAEPVLTTLISAASNAKNNQDMSKAKLYVSECFADQAGQLKRFRPRAKGRPYKILKPVSHLTIKVAERE